MPRKLPGYLRLHIEESRQHDPPQFQEVQCLSQLCQSFERATGWRLRRDHEEDSAGSWSRCVGDPEDDGANWLALEYAAGSSVLAATAIPADEPAAAKELAASIADLLDELHETRRALWKREAELAATVPVTPHPDEQKHLAVRLATILRLGAQAVGCQAAAAYMLDDSTRELKLRTSWGLPKNRFLDPPRPLRGAAGDLEALVGHAVVLEDTALLADWRVPEEFRSAVCLPISSPTVPLGTLWVYCEHPRTFSEHETDVLEIVAGRIAAELERESLLNQTLSQKLLNRQLLHAVQWQQSRLPRIKPLLDGWDVAGWTSQAETLGGDFHDWAVLPDGTLAIAVGDAEGRVIEAGLTAASVHTALKSHAFYRHTPQQMLERVNETLWTACAGDQFASMFYGVIDPETGRFDHASAGHVHATIIGETSRHLPSEPLQALGASPDNRYPFSTNLMQPGDILLVYSDGVKKVLPDSSQAGHLLGRLVENHQESTADELVEQIQAFLVRHTDGPPAQDQTVIIVKRA